MALKLYTFPGNPRANKALIAAKYNGVDITIPAGFVMGESNKTPEFLALNPLGKVPTLETPEGGIFESNAILLYLADKNFSPLLPVEPTRKSEVEQWLMWQVSALGPTLGQVRGRRPPRRASRGWLASTRVEGLARLDARAGRRSPFRSCS